MNRLNTLKAFPYNPDTLNARETALSDAICYMAGMLDSGWNHYLYHTINNSFVVQVGKLPVRGAEVANSAELSSMVRSYTRDSDDCSAAWKAIVESAAILARSVITGAAADALEKLLMTPRELLELQSLKREFRRGLCIEMLEREPSATGEVYRRPAGYSDSMRWGLTYEEESGMFVLAQGHPGDISAENFHECWERSNLGHGGTYPLDEVMDMYDEPLTSMYGAWKNARQDSKT